MLPRTKVFSFFLKIEFSLLATQFKTEKFVVVAVRSSPEVENTSTVLAEVEAEELSLQSALHVPPKRAVVMLTDSSLELVDSSSPHPESRKKLKNKRRAHFFII